MADMNIAIREATSADLPAEATSVVIIIAAASFFSGALDNPLITA